jgi:Flp pilus assembly protein TadD
MNLALHATAACLFVAILRRLCVPGAWVAGALFALHPVCVESVAWISEEKNTLSTVFYLLAARVYLDFDERRTGWLYAVSTVLFAAALLTKSVTATLPAALLVVFWWRRGTLSWRRDCLPLLPWLALGAAMGLFAGWVERAHVGAEGPDFAFSPVERVLIAGRAIAFYAGKLLWPANLVFIYPRWRIDPRSALPYAYPVGVCALSVLLWSIRGRSRAPLAGWLFFVGSLFPILGFLNVYAFLFSFVADHWQYLASLGAFAAAGAGWHLIGEDRPVPRRWRLAKAIFGGAVLGVLGALTWRQCRVYQDADTLYRSILALNPACWMAHDNLGLILDGKGRPGEAAVEFKEALRFRPEYPEAFNNLGVTLYQMGRDAEALAQYRRAAELNPRYAEPHNNMGALFFKRGQMGEAIAQFKETVRLNGDDSETHRNLGLALEADGQKREAEAQFALAARLRAEQMGVHAAR